MIDLANSYFIMLIFFHSFFLSSNKPVGKKEEVLNVFDKGVESQARDKILSMILKGAETKKIK